MNYVLQLSLEGASETDAALDNLLKKVGQLSSGGIMAGLSDAEMDKAIDETGLLKSSENSGVKAGKKMAEGIQKGLKNVLWTSKEMLGTPRLPQMPKWMNEDFFKKGEQKTVTPPKMKGTEGENLAKVLSLPDINDLTKYNGKVPPILEKPDIKKVLLGLGLGYSNPYIGARLISDEMGKGNAGGIAGGLFGKGGIGGFSEIFAAFKVFHFGAKMFAHAAEMFGKTIETARQFYAKSLQSGMGLNFTIKRGMLAEIMGVSETDVFRFGAAMAYLNPKLQNATSILARTTPELTSVSWDLKVLEKDFGALAATIGADLAPAIKRLINALDELIKGATWIYDHTPKKEIATGVASLIFGPINTLLARLGISELVKQFPDKAAPTPMAQMKQLPAAAWEQMGLVMGVGQQNYAKDTARNTRESAAALKQIAKYFITGNSNRNQFGMSPTTANA